MIIQDIVKLLMEYASSHGIELDQSGINLLSLNQNIKKKYFSPKPKKKIILLK